MVEVLEVKNKAQQRAFLQFPLTLYKGNPSFTPPIYIDEKKIFNPDYCYYEHSEAVYYNAYRDGQMVGRISGILQRASNEKRNEKRVRFTRFDAVDDVEVAEALFGAVEAWALSKGMDTVCGPLGFSDMEREGLLVDGFNEISTLAEQYNASYYPALVEHCGYEKEVDWIESKIYAPDEKTFRVLERVAHASLEKNQLRLITVDKLEPFIKRYRDEFFEMIDEGYRDLYGTVPFTERMRDMIIENFKAVLDPRYFAVIVNEKDELVCLGLCYPWVGEALQKSSGHLTPGCILRLLRAVRKPRILELALIVVSSKYRDLGVNAILLHGLAKILRDSGIEYAETNLNLEDNVEIRRQWKRRFNSVEHKRRRAYVKKLL